MSALDDLLDAIDADRMLYNGRTSACRTELSDLRSELSRLKAEREWKPIESVPTGKRVVLADSKYQWHGVVENISMGKKLAGEPTHWMPLPQPPEDAE